MQIEGTELTESGQRARSNRNFRLGSIYTVRHAAGNDRCLRTAAGHGPAFARLTLRSSCQLAEASLGELRVSRILGTTFPHRSILGPTVFSHKRCGRPVVEVR